MESDIRDQRREFVILSIDQEICFFLVDRSRISGLDSAYCDGLHDGDHSIIYTNGLAMLAPSNGERLAFAAGSGGYNQRRRYRLDGREGIICQQKSQFKCHTLQSVQVTSLEGCCPGDAELRLVLLSRVNLIILTLFALQVSVLVRITL